MSNFISDEEWNELVMAHLSGVPTPAQAARLEALLEGDCDNLERYTHYVRESANLHRTLRTMDNSPPSRSDRGMGSNEVTIARKSSSEAVPTTPVSLPWWVSFALAASLFVALLGWWSAGGDIVEGLRNDTLPVTAISSGKGTQDVLAKIVRKVDCVWEDEKWKVGATAALTKDQMLRIGEGLMEIEYVCGARVALQGPARFKITGPKSGVLYAGQLTAHVPDGAEGFSVQAPTANVVDLGTSFSLNVRNNGSTELYVIDGEVTYQPLKLGGHATGSEATLKKEDAVLVEMDSTQPIPFENAPRLLWEEMVGSNDKIDWPRSALSNLVLWLDASWDVETDNNGKVRRWGDRLYGENTRSEMAWQIRETNRPLWLAQGMGGKPALEFDGKSSYLVTDELSTTDEQTILVVAAADAWTVPSKLRFPSRQILNYNGPPNLVIQLVEQDCIACWNYSTTSSYDSPHDRIGQLSAGPWSSGSPALICYRYSLNDQSTDLQVNGKNQCRASVATPAAINSPKYIGCHWSESQHFAGRLAELIIFNKSLSDDDTRLVVEYLAEKYSIALEQ
jgi:hypothetical protein